MICKIIEMKKQDAKIVKENKLEKYNWKSTTGKMKL